MKNPDAAAPRIVWLVVAICFFATASVVLGSLLFVKTRPDALRKASNPYPLIDFARSFIGQEHYLTTIQPLRARIKEMADEFESGSVSVYIEYLNTGANISINPELYIWPASLTKVPLAMAVMKKIERGEWKLSNELVLMRGDGDDKSGDSENPLSEYPIGTRFTIEKLLEELLINSDNTAYFIFLRNLHQDDLKNVIQSLGMEALFTEEGKISAKEYSRVLRALYTASFLSREHSQYMLELLDRATFDKFISGAVPAEVPFPHKYGENKPLAAYSDSGIAYVPDRPYIISVMVQGDPQAPHDVEAERVAAFMKMLSKEAYDYFRTEINR